MSERDLFIAALKLTEPAERAAWLDRECDGDAALRQRIDVLLQAFDKAGSLLENPVVALGLSTDEPMTEGPGTVIGRYKLLEQIGEGGFGVVFMAEQQQPLRRKVALKVIKPGMDTRQVIARFEAERQALALMDHPHIARVLDAGSTPGPDGTGLTGRPYFVMELVRGIPITQFCDEKRLTARERLELFVTICQAVQHAHQKGIIHRDLKPSNVLVTLQDGTPVVKVIDFGIAKALSQERLTEKTLCTGFAQMLGTPLYMSPEQAEMSVQDADTRTDIYSLGVLLYELLTGTTPFDKERLKEATYEELRRILREEEPAKPSTRISTLGQAATTVSANRKSEPRRLSQLFRGELDWIVMKALEKDRNRRYETASTFAADVQRHLHDEPVHACPPSPVYRLHKFTRRNKAVLMTASAITVAVLLAVAGLAARTVAVRQANEELRQHLYYQSIALAERELSVNNLDRAEQLLNECPTDLRGWEWRYLKQLPLQNIVPLRHEAAVFSAGFSPDGCWIASGSKDGKVIVWNAMTGRQLFSLQAHKHHVRCVAFSPDGRCLATASWDKTVKIWAFDPQREAANCSLLHTLTDHKTQVNSVAFSPDGRRLVSAGWDNVGAWDLATGHQISSFDNHMNGIHCVAYSPDGQYLALAGDDATVGIWDATTGREQRNLLGHSAPVLSVTFSRDGRWLAATTGDMATRAQGEIKIWDAGTGREVYTLRGHTTLVYHAKFSPDGRRLASAGTDGTLKLWDLSTGKEVLTLRGHRSQVDSVDFSGDGNRLVSASFDNTVRIWDASPLEKKTGQESLTLRDHHSGVRSVAFSPNGQWLASAANDGTVRIWDYKLGLAGSTNPLICTLENWVGCSQVVFSHNGKLLAVAGRFRPAAKKVRLWDTSTWKLLYERPSIGSPCAFSPDDQDLAACESGSEPVIEIRRVATEQEISRLRGHDWAIWDIAFHPHPDFPYLASGSADGTVRVWDLRRKELLTPPLRHTIHVRCLAFSQDGHYLATGGDDRTVQIWDTQTWKRIQQLSDPTGSVESVAFHPTDSRVLAWGGADSTVKVWNSTTEKTRTFQGHMNWVLSVAFSPDGEWIASASLDGTVKIWKAPPL